MMKKILNMLPPRLIIPLFLVAGVLAGLGAYSFYMSRSWSYIKDDPAVCVNCHIMAPWYQSWSRSSHQPWTTCNDCHVPQDNFLAQYSFKAVDGLYHAAVFTLRAEPQTLRPRPASYAVIMDNCIRCHTQLNTEFVKTGMLRYADTQNGQGKACWDCHREVPHGRAAGLSSSPNAIVPLPASPVPQWLKDIL